MRKQNNSCQERLAYFIKYSSLNQKEIAEKAGIRESSLSNYLHGKSRPNMEIVCKLSEALDVSTDWLLGYGENDQGIGKSWDAKLLESYHKLDPHTKEIIHDILGIYPESDDWLSASTDQHNFTDKEIMDKIEAAKKDPSNITPGERALLLRIKGEIIRRSKPDIAHILQSHIQAHGPISEAADVQLQKMLEEYNVRLDE